MKDLEEYILEKQNFLVKKHIDFDNENKLPIGRVDGGIYSIFIRNQYEADLFINEYPRYENSLNISTLSKNYYYIVNNSKNLNQFTIYQTHKDWCEIECYFDVKNIYEKIKKINNKK